MNNWLKRDCRTWLQSAGTSALAFSVSVFLVIASEQPDISVAPFPLHLEVSPARGRSHKGKYSSSRLHGRSRGFVWLCNVFHLTKRDAVVGVGVISQTRHRLQTFDTAEFLSEVGSFTGASQLINRGLNHFSVLLTP